MAKRESIIHDIFLKTMSDTRINVSMVDDQLIRINKLLNNKKLTKMWRDLLLRSAIDLRNTIKYLKRDFVNKEQYYDFNVIDKDAMKKYEIMFDIRIENCNKIIDN